MIPIALLIIAIVASIVAYVYWNSSMTAEELSHYTGHPPSAWGKETWKLMHLVAINFPLEPTEADREAFSTFIRGLSLVLPCMVCRSHFQEMLSGEFAIQTKDLTDRASVFGWTVRVHNHVNQRLNKTHPASMVHWFNVYTLMRNG